MRRVIDKDRHLRDIPGALPRTKKTKKTKAPATEQKYTQPLVDQYLMWSHHKWFRIPDAAYRAIFANPNLPKWTKKEIKEYLAGFPDVLLLKQGKGKYNEAALLEIKSPGRKQNKKQKEFVEGLNYHISEDIDDAIKFIKEFYAD